jgi:transposase
VSERLRVREIDDDEGQRLVRIVRRGSGSVVTWRRAQMVLLSAQGMDAPVIAKVAFTSEDRVRDVIRNFNADGFGSLYPKDKGGRPPNPRRRMRATRNRTAGVRHLFAAYELGADKLFGHVKPRKTRVRFLEFCRYLRSLYPATTRIAIVCDNFSPHLSTRKDRRVGTWATANNVEIAYTPTNSSWLNRIEAQFTALRYFALDGTDHASHKDQARIIRRYIIWRNNHAYGERLRRIVAKANVA